MKPPSRKRTLPLRFLQKEPEQRRRAKEHSGWCLWKWNERRALLAELKKQPRNAELDMVALQAKFPNRTVQQIESFIQFLKTVVGKRVTTLINRLRLEQDNGRVPIELWTEMAQKMAGSQQDTISSAFSQMLVIAATEPCTLLNSNPPRSLSTPRKLLPNLPSVPSSLKGRPPGKAASTYIPPRQNGSAQISSVLTPENPAVNCQKGLLPFSEANSNLAVLNLACNSHPSLLNFAATAIPMNVKVKQGSISDNSRSPISPLPCDVHVNQSTSMQGLTVPKSNQPAEQAVCPSTKTFTQGQEHSSPIPVQGPISHQQTKPQVDFSVDFENIYRFLSSVYKQGKMTPLSPMESAVVLDLLLSLPEQIPVLNCEELQQHFRQVYGYLSAPVKEPAQPASLEQEAASHLAQTGGATQGTSLQTDISAILEGGPLHQSLCTGSAVADALTEKAAFCSSEMEHSDSLPQTLTSQQGNDRGHGDKETSADQSVIQDPTVQGADIPAVGSLPQLQTANSELEKSIFEKLGLCPLNPFIIPMKLLAQSQTPLSDG